jgi:pyruvate carboxylase
MKFYQLGVGDRFKFNDQEYVKVQEVKANCCKIKENCKVVGSGEKAVLKPLDEVEKVSGN